MNSEQKNRFLGGEGDAYFARNESVLSHDANIAFADPVLPVLREIQPFPQRVLEVGCANGWRLNRMSELGARECHGIDPSRAAVEAGASAYPSLRLHVGTADVLNFPAGSFDLVVFGFCLYLCDPEDHLKILFEADRVLTDGGHVVIFDFDPPAPYQNPYMHQPGLSSFKMDFSRLFLAHPHYTLRIKKSATHGTQGSAHPDERLAVWWLTKNSAAAWPLNPWKRES